MKGKKSATTKKEGESTTYTHCQRVGHDDSNYWKLHPKLKPNNLNKKKDEMKAPTRFGI